MIIDTHCHVIAGEATAPGVPVDGRPAVSRDSGRYRLGFRGREINSLVSGCTDAGLPGADRG